MKYRWDSMNDDISVDKADENVDEALRLLGDDDEDLQRLKDEGDERTEMNEARSRMVYGIIIFRTINSKLKFIYIQAKQAQKHPHTITHSPTQC